MPVAFDNTVSTVLLNPRAGIPTHPDTGETIELGRERVEGLVQRLQKDGERIILPTPVIAELLTVSGPEGLQYLETITKSKVFEIGAFDLRAALELSLMNRSALAVGDKKGGIASPWQKVKFDRQIVAICKVYGVSVLYTDDAPLARIAAQVGLKTAGIHELEVPDEARQGKLQLEPHEEPPTETGEIHADESE